MSSCQEVLKPFSEFCRFQFLLLFQMVTQPAKVETCALGGEPGVTLIASCHNCIFCENILHLNGQVL